LARIRSPSKERTFAALELLGRTIGIDPNYGPALSWAAVCHWQCVTDGWVAQPEVSRRNAVDLAAGAGSDTER
jgi:hypothetical protein